MLGMFVRVNVETLRSKLSTKVGQRSRLRKLLEVESVSETDSGLLLADLSRPECRIGNNSNIRFER